MAVYQRKLSNGKRSKTWYIDIYRNGKNHRISSGTENKYEALQMELELRAALDKQSEEKRISAFIEKLSGRAVTEKGFALKAVWPYFEREFCNGIKESTLRRKRNEWNNFLSWLDCNRPGLENLRDIDFRGAKEYSQYLLKNVSNHTHNGKISMLKEVFRRMAQPAGLNDNPFDFVQFLKAEHRSYRIFTPEEIKRLLGKANADWKTAIMLSLYTGLDFANVRSLRWSDIHEVELDGEKVQILKTQRIKTSGYGKKPLLIPLHSELWNHLSGLKSSGEYILPDKFQTRGCEGEFPALLKECGIKDTADGKTGFHCLRHTFNTKLESVETAPDVRQKLLGHSSLDMNIIYSHAIEPLKKAVDSVKY